MRRMISGKAQKYIKDLATNHPDPSAEWGGSGTEYTAGNGIDITDSEISVNYGTGLTVDDETLIVDTSTIATKSELFSGDYNDLTNKPTIPAAQVQSDWSQSDNTQVDFIKNKPTIPAAVSGTNDGTNWTNLTIGSDTYAIPQGGGSSYTFTNGLTESNGTVTFNYNKMFGNVASNSTQKIGANYYGITISDQNNNTAYIIKEDSNSAGVFKRGLTVRPYSTEASAEIEIIHSSSPVAHTIDPELRLLLNTSSSIKRYIGSSEKVIDAIYVNELTDGTNTVSVADLAALITYAKSQGWIQ